MINKARLEEIEKARRAQEAENALIDGAKRAKAELKDANIEGLSMKEQLEIRTAIMKKHYNDYKDVFSYTMFKHKMMLLNNPTKRG